MASLKGLTLLCLLVLTVGMAAGALHPVQGLLEKFGAGPGCASRGLGERETHVISIGRATRSPSREVTVLLRPLSLFLPHSRPLALVLRSKHTVRWLLQAERVQQGLPHLIQVSESSSVDWTALGGSVTVQSVRGLPSRPRTLLLWALNEHSSVTSLVHTPRANRIYIRLGSDPMMPSACVLQPLFLSQNYLTSDLQPQEVKGCSSPGQGHNPEVHVIDLHSAGSSLCGSVQVEVEVSLQPPTAGRALWGGVVLVLRSRSAVSWALLARDLETHVTTFSSSNVVARWAPDPRLTLTSQISTDLLMTSDLLAWANQMGFSNLTSYTEAELANRFVIKLVGGDRPPGQPQPVPGPRLWPQQAPGPGIEALQVQQWLRQGAGRGGLLGNEGEEEEGAQAMHVLCQWGALSVTVDRETVEPVSAVTLSDPRCWAQSNGTHFFLEYPVISCGTEAEFLYAPRSVLYRNTVLLWRPTYPVAVGNETQDTGSEDSWGLGQTPLAIPFSCLAPVPPRPSAPSALPRLKARRPGSVLDRGAPGSQRGERGPLFSLELYASQTFQQREAGPCVIAANNRVFAEVSVLEGCGRLGVRVQSCMLSPHSDPQAEPGWTVIEGGCPQDPSVTFYSGQEESESEGGGGPTTERGGTPDRQGDRRARKDERRRQTAKEGKTGAERAREQDILTQIMCEGGEQERQRRTAGEQDRGERSGGEQERERRTAGEQETGEKTEREEERERRTGGQGQEHRLRFSFVLRPVYNNSVQFLHCRLRQCLVSQGSPAGPGPSGTIAGGHRKRGIPDSTPRRCYGQTQTLELAQNSSVPQCLSLDELCTGRLPSLPSVSQCPECAQFTWTVSRPMLVTQSVEVVQVAAHTAGQRVPNPRMAVLSTPSPAVSSPASLDTAVVAGISFIAFLIGVSLTGVLWCIYFKTGTPEQRRRSSLNKADRTTVDSRNPPILVEHPSCSL
ncbi:transforming growth factor beta receptor type 3 isoform X2 [Lepisosteus oculatus]|uniref:transforming growth factor beta receptor type 3 isoform X2 n=1 Tax=Lepisosteus oculatus TaxID=7918 RepID=UPI0035F51F04